MTTERTIREIMDRYLAERPPAPKLSRKQRRRANDADRAAREQKARDTAALAAKP